MVYEKKGDAEEGNWRKPEKKRKKREKASMMVMSAVGFKWKKGFDGITRSRSPLSLSSLFV